MRFGHKVGVYNLLLFFMVCTELTANEAVTSSSENDLLRVNYPVFTSSGDAHSVLVQSMVELALNHQSKPWSFNFIHLPMERKRQEIELGKGKLINTLMLPGTNDYDDRFLLVPVPVDRGLIGLRVSFIRKDEPDTLSQVRNLADLKKLTVCSDANWTVTRVFKDNALPVHSTPEYLQNFASLIRNECDHFSRGIAEIEAELKHYQNQFPQFGIDPYVALQIPLAFYLYVSPHHSELQQALSEGMQNAVEKGAFFELFDELFRDQLNKLNIENRNFIKLSVEDPHLVTEQNGSFWLQ